MIGDRGAAARVILAAALLLPDLAATAQAPPAPTAPATELPSVIVISASPLRGAGLDRNKEPAATNVLTNDDVARTGIIRNLFCDKFDADCPGTWGQQSAQPQTGGSGGRFWRRAGNLLDEQRRIKSKRCFFAKKQQKTLVRLPECSVWAEP